MSTPDNRTDKRKLGALGESFACSFLENKGLRVMDRNYLKKWGDIDIVVEKGGLWRFIEVKSIKNKQGNVTREKEKYVPQETYRPEDNIHPQKLRRLARTIETYILEKKIDAEWQIDAITVRLDMENRRAKIDWIENIVGI